MVARVLAAALAASLLLPAAAAADRWVRDADGVCRREWTPSSMARGPIAMGNTVLLPFRSLAGSFTDGWEGAVLFPLSLMVGLAEGFMWAVTGAAELLTGGAVALAPEGAVEGLSIRPVTQLPPSLRNLDAYDVDRCGEAGIP